MIMMSFSGSFSFLAVRGFFIPVNIWTAFFCVLDIASSKSKSVAFQPNSRSATELFLGLIFYDMIFVDGFCMSLLSGISPCLGVVACGFLCQAFY